MIRRFLLVLCSGAALLLVLTGCGERKESVSAAKPRQIEVALAADAGDAAVFAADAAGEFRRAGLDVQLHTIENPLAAMRQVSSGNADLAIGSEPALLEERARGAKLVSVAALVRSPLTSLITPAQGPAATLGKLLTKPIVVDSDDYEREFAEAIFEKAGGRANVKQVSDLRQAIVTESVAAVIAPYGAAQLPGGLRARPVDQDQAVPTFSDYIVVARAGDVRGEADMIRAFVGAVARGARQQALDQVDHPGVAPVLKSAGAANIRRFMLPAKGRPFGWQEPAQWKRFAAWMKGRGLKVSGADGAFTNELLPGQEP